MKMPTSYTVTSPGYGGGYTNHAFNNNNGGENGREMAELYSSRNVKNGGGNGMTTTTTSMYTANNGFSPHHQRNPSMSMQQMQMDERDNNVTERGGRKGGNAVAPSSSAPPMPSHDEEEEYDRGHWGSKAEFILSCIGFSVGIGNVWRFPYLAYQNGGGAFLFPYVILLIFVGKPMYYLETAIGQYARTSPLQLWRCAPIAVGVGFAMIVLSLIVCIYYNVIMAYSIFYIGASFVGTYDELPWTYCGEWWGADENCVVTSNLTNKAFLNLPRCRPLLNMTENCTNSQSSASQFWEKYVLKIDEGGLGPNPGDIGTFTYELPLCLLLAWLVVFLCLMKGVKSSGKVVYFTATFPYVILIALLVRGCMLEGASKGLYYLFVPKWEKLLELAPWRAAAEQMFFSLGISWGGLMMFGSYNKFHNKIHIDAAVVSSLDFITSLIASVVIFSVLGFLSEKLDVDIENVAQGGQGLAFVVYPEALSHLPLPWLWAILFFLMLFFLGLDSEFALLETVLTILYDGIPRLRNHKIKMTFFACCACFLLGLPCVSSSGQYILDLMDTYGAGFAVLWTGFWELVGLMWIYGYRNVCRDFKLMLGSEPSWFWKITWTVISPLVLITIVILGVLTWGEHKYSGVIPYPEWATAVGWTLVAISAIQIPLWAIIMSVYYLIKGKFSEVIKPTSQWGPGDKAVRAAILDEQSGINRNGGGKYSYDNYNYHI